MRTEFRVFRLLLSRSFLCLFIFCLLLLQGVTARAQGFDISIMFTPDTKTIMQGDTNPVDYTALFSNNTTKNLLINLATFSSADPVFNSVVVFNGDGNPMTGGAFELAAGQQNFTVPNVVSLLVDPTVPTGNYTFNGSFTGRDYSDANDPAVSDRELGLATLHVQVEPAGAGSPTPEFGTVWTLGGLLLAGGIGAWRQHRRRPTTSREASHAA